MLGGDNVILVRLTAEDGTVRTYTVTVAHPAAEDVVLVENLDNDVLDDGYYYVTAQGFTTGSNPGGYRLDSATVRLDGWADDASDSDTHATVWTDVGARPGELIASLGRLSLGTGQRTYLAERLLLAPDTTYFLVFNHGLATSEQGGLKYTDDHDDQSAHGWSISDKLYFSDDQSLRPGALLYRLCRCA